LHSTSTPQGKALVERVFGTLQDRMIAEMRLEGIQTMDEANLFLEQFIEEYNNKFAIQLYDTKNCFEKSIKNEEIPFYLSIVQKRVIDNGNCVRFENNYYLPMDDKNNVKLFLPNTKVIVVKDYKGNYFLNVHEKLYTLIKNKL
jgi:hypothetical protein